MNHIIVNVIDNQLECTHCGTAYKTSFKKSIEQYPQTIKAFTTDHKHCIKPKRKKRDKR
jgi:hypothetical protein